MRRKPELTKWESDLRVKVVGDEILVTLPQSNYAVRYYKPKNSPQLLAKRIRDKDDPHLPMTGAEFLTQAWKLANDKARALGWIV